MVVLQAFIKTAAVSGIAFSWVNFTVESLKMVWHIISSPEKTLMAPFKAACGNCQELYDDDEYHLIHGTLLCEACR